jgi:predicted transcriptional regulator
MESLTITRIKSLLEREKETPNSFAKKVGVSSTAIYHIIEGGQPRVATIDKIVAAYPNYTKEWLLGADTKVIDASERMELDRLREENKWLKGLVERLTGQAAKVEKAAGNFKKALAKAGKGNKVLAMYSFQPLLSGARA